MAFPGPRLTAALAVPVSAAIGVVTGLVTNQPRPGMIAAFVALIVVGMLLAARAVTGPGGLRRTRSRMTAHGGVIRNSGHTLSGGADVTTTATSRGRIERSPIIAAGTDHTLEASDGGEITDSPIDASP